MDFQKKEARKSAAASAARERALERSREKAEHGKLPHGGNAPVIPGEAAADHPVHVRPTDEQGREIRRRITGKRKRASATGGDDQQPRRLEVVTTGPSGPTDPAEASSSLSAPLRRLHERLKDPVNLLKLHIQHYHMSESSFRKRTVALKLPKEV